MTSWIPTPKILANGEDVSAEVINPILLQHTNRSQYLKEQLEAIGSKSVLLAMDQPLVNNTIVAGNIVALKDVAGVQKLDLAKVDYGSNGVVTSFVPNNSCYVFGVVKEVKQVGTVVTGDIYTQGLITIPNVSSLIATGETLRPGPYFLSRKQAGKLTSDPSGLAVFVGFAKSNTEFYLNPSTDVLNQLFLNYRFIMIDRPIGKLVETAGLWSIEDQDLSKVGWGMADPSCAPPNAKFFYNLPTDAQIEADNTLTDLEKIEAKLLKKALPFYPTSFNILSINGLTQLYRDENDYEDISNQFGTYAIDQIGIWWFFNDAASIPWAAGLVENWDLADVSDGEHWTESPVMLTSTDRNFTILYATKLNPELKSAAVTTIQPFKDANNDSANVLQFYDASNKTKTAKTGDLLAKFNLTLDTTNLTDPDETESATAIKSVAYNQLTGKLEISTGKVVTSIKEGTAITITEDDEGNHVISTNTQATFGTAIDLEPDNATLEYLGLHSYLKFVPTATLPTGLFGKIVLPSTVANATRLILTILAFGDLDSTLNSTNKSMSFNFSYAIAKPGAVLTSLASSPVTVTKALTSYRAKTIFNWNPAGLEIQSSDLVANAAVHFKLTRSDTGGSAYGGNVGILGIHWNVA